MQYEILYLIDQNNEGRSQEIEKSVEEVISKNGGEILPEKWEDKRKLAYPVDHVVKGMYVARRFNVEKQDPWAQEEAPVSVVSSITKDLNLSKDILRFVIVKAEGMLSLNEFVLRKNEELKARKKPQPTKTPQRSERTRVQKAAPVSEPPKETAPQKTGSKAEIDEKLDEILNI